MESDEMQKILSLPFKNDIFATIETKFDGVNPSVLKMLQKWSERQSTLEIGRSYFYFLMNTPQLAARVRRRSFTF